MGHADTSSTISSSALINTKPDCLIPATCTVKSHSCTQQQITAKVCELCHLFFHELAFRAAAYAMHKQRAIDNLLSFLHRKLFLTRSRPYSWTSYGDISSGQYANTNLRNSFIVDTVTLWFSKLLETVNTRPTQTTSQITCHVGTKVWVCEILPNFKVRNQKLNNAILFLRIRRLWLQFFFQNSNIFFSQLQFCTNAFYKKT